MHLQSAFWGLLAIAFNTAIQDFGGDCRLPQEISHGTPEITILLRARHS